MGLIGLQFPDISVVFCDGSVGGEEAGLGGVCKAFLQPADGIAGVVSHGLLLSHHIGIEVRQGLEPVLIDQLVLQAFQVFCLTVLQHLFAG